MFKKLLFLVLAWLVWVSGAYAFSFAVFGDNCGDKQIARDLRDRINSDKNLVFAVCTGDFVPNGRAGEYKAYKKEWAKFKIPIYHAMGNHDGMRGGWKIFEKEIGPAYYYFDYEGARFIVLNNAFRESFDRWQFNWLKEVLAGSDAKHKFVFMHKPVFDPSEIYADHIMSGRAVIEELMRLFEKYKVEYVFAGHIHGYARSERNGIVYIVSGGGGQQLYLPPEFGGFYNYVKVTVDEKKVTDKVQRIYE